ncbi:hypothetical protein [Vreelandella azerica]|uniref:hypothetical protein n=1 Tax=Vreelandella azerica TaxID=2732867 RepID=UPI001C114ADD|nr:hypothetical protein [Halomonas azerica]
MKHKIAFLRDQVLNIFPVHTAEWVNVVMVRRNSGASVIKEAFHMIIPCLAQPWCRFQINTAGSLVWERESLGIHVDLGFRVAAAKVKVGSR